MARSAPPTRLCAAAGTGRVAITDTRHLDLADLRAALRAKPVLPPNGADGHRRAAARLHHPSAARHARRDLGLAGFRPFTCGFLVELRGFEPLP